MQIGLDISQWPQIGLDIGQHQVSSKKKKCIFHGLDKALIKISFPFKKKYFHCLYFVTHLDLDRALGGNPLHCDCSLKWLAEWIQVGYKEPGIASCVGPEGMHNNLLLTTRLSQFQCLQGRCVHMCVTEKPMTKQGTVVLGGRRALTAPPPSGFPSSATAACRILVATVPFSLWRCQDLLLDFNLQLTACDLWTALCLRTATHWPMMECSTRDYFNKENNACVLFLVVFLDKADPEVLSQV